MGRPNMGELQNFLQIRLAEFFTLFNGSADINHALKLVERHNMLHFEMQIQTVFINP